MAEGAGALGLGGVHASGIAALAVRDLAEGRYEEAYVRLKPLVDDPFLQVTPLEYPDFVEAAARSGHPDDAEEVVGRLEAIAAANESAWATGVAQRSRALVDDTTSEPCYRTAIETLTGAGLDLDLARAHLLYGEWLRRARRRRVAREHLKRAADALRRRGCPRLRAARTSRARGNGRTLDRSTHPVRDRLHRAGAHRGPAGGRRDTNAEIGASMFLSVNTVDYHLRKVFAKLGISSRRQLADRLREEL